MKRLWRSLSNLQEAGEEFILLITKIKIFFNAVFDKTISVVPKSIQKLA